MSYQQALEAAGARVIAFEHFGDWQGSWVALVEYQGATGWVHGWFGSCTECDAFQGEFGFDDYFESEYERERLASFGQTYLEGLMSTERVLSYYQTDSEWDSDAQDAMFWIRETEQTYRNLEITHDQTAMLH